jgi:hypothetical protein
MMHFGVFIRFFVTFLIYSFLVHAHFTLFTHRGTFQPLFFTPTVDFFHPVSSFTLAPYFCVAQSIAHIAFLSLFSPVIGRLL